MGVLMGVLDVRHHLNDLLEQEGEVVHGDAQHDPLHVVARGASLSLIPVSLFHLSVDASSKHLLLMPTIPLSLEGSSCSPGG
jgi:hypothetical protein